MNTEKQLALLDMANQLINALENLSPDHKLLKKANAVITSVGNPAVMLKEIKKDSKTHEFVDLCEFLDLCEEDSFGGVNASIFEQSLLELEPKVNNTLDIQAALNFEDRPCVKTTNMWHLEPISNTMHKD